MNQHPTPNHDSVTDNNHTYDSLTPPTPPLTIATTPTPPASPPLPNTSPSTSPPTPRSTPSTIASLLPTQPASTSTSSSPKFRLTKSFVDSYRDRPPPFGYNGLGELVYLRTYSRKLPNNQNEAWYQTVERVVNGTYSMQRAWIESHRLGWNARKAQQSAQEMYRRIWEMKFLPPGRGLWAMGSPITEERRLYAALNNCAFVSTDDMKEEPTKAFAFLMDASMLGVGVGFDTKGAGSVAVKGPKQGQTEVFVIPDSREGWVESLRLLLDSYFQNRPLPVFDFSHIRPYGTPIQGFGGLASGPSALRELLESVKLTLDKRVGSPLSVTDIVDIMNFIGRCVVAGNVRRTAEIAFGDPTSSEYLDLKNYTLNPSRAAYGWTSNNSVFAKVGMDYEPAAQRIRVNGEPGFAWLENMQQFGRMNGVEDRRDHRAKGGNPCLEQTLESYEMCCLVETFPHRHADLEDFKRTLKFAYLYAKTVTLGKTHWPDTNRVMLRNRRIGCSVSGIAQFISQRSLGTLQRWLTEGYDTIQHYDRTYSDWLAIPRSIKTTSVKPSGTVSLLAGATPGMHYPESRFYIRRVRLAANSALIAALRKANYHIEPVADGDPTTVVVSIPIDVGEGVRTSKQVSMWEQLSLAAFLQRYWADNQVSCTVTFDPSSEGSHIAHALNYYQYQLKGISFLPRIPAGAYKQMPYEEITEQQYQQMMADLKVVEWSSGGVVTTYADRTVDRFCDGDSCAIEPDRSGQEAEKAMEEEAADVEAQQNGIGG